MHATEEFAAEQDHITPFLDEVCDRSDPDAIVLAEELFKARQEWNASRNERPNESQKAFGDALKARGLRHGPDDPRTRRTRWKGIKLRNLHRLHSLPMESPGLCVTTDEENTEIRNILGGDQEAEDARREFHRLMLAV
jgi:phage/plasmid-associated DNA primase